MYKHPFKHTCIALLAISLLFTACGTQNKKDKKPLLPPVSGKPGDITLVIPKTLWDNELGDTIRWAFYQEYYGLPEIEPLFNLMHVPTDAFSTLFQSTRNILIIKVDDSYNQPKVLVQNNLWAKPQIVVNLIASNKTEAINMFLEKQERIVKIFENTERKRFTDIYKKSPDNALISKLEEKHGIHLDLPNGYEMGMDSTSFTWIDNQQNDNITQGFFIYHYPYTDTNTFSKSFLVNKRNQVLKHHVHGANPGSYMTTENLLPPRFTELVLKDDTYVAELRGLWKIKKDLMGGPFVSYTIYNKQLNRIISVEGYVFAPGHKKRNLVRQLEAILITATIADKNKKEGVDE